jgi:hypothetical protein
VTVDANGAPVAAATPGSGGAVPSGDGPFGAEAPQGAIPPAPPPPPTPVDGRVVEYQKLVDEMSALLQEQATQLEQRTDPRAKRSPSKLSAKFKDVPKRYAVPLCVAGAMVVTYVGIAYGTPRHDEATVAALAADFATNAAVGEQDARWAEMRAEATSTVEPEPLSVYGLELDENAKTAIGWVGTPGNLRLNVERAEYVAKQVRVLSAKFRLLDLRMSSLSPTELRVHTNVAEGFPLFKPPAVEAPAAPTTATSAP